MNINPYECKRVKCWDERMFIYEDINVFEKNAWQQFYK